jgi:hypothetical protein
VPDHESPVRHSALPDDTGSGACRLATLLSKMYSSERIGLDLLEKICFEGLNKSKVNCRLEGKL